MTIAIENQGLSLVSDEEVGDATGSRDRPATGEQSSAEISLLETPSGVDIAIVGLGYVGLPTALAFHAAGRTVLGIDVSRHRLDEIREQRADLLDSDRHRLALALGEPQEFSISADPAELARADAILICVPTPVDAYLMPDLAILRAACAQVVANAVAGQAIILTSTTYVGSTQEMLVEPLRARGLQAGADVAVAFSPERIDPGNTGHLHEDVPRVVGGATEQCTERVAEILAGYARHVHRVVSPEVAEMVKLVENTFRAVNIALVNEVADICHTLALPVLDVIDAAATKPYGFMPFYPGPGVGGHCIPCDPHYLLWQLRRTRLQTPIIAQAMHGIATRPHRVVDRLREVLSEAGLGLVGTRVLVVGVSYKPDVEDVRESPALEIIATLHKLGAQVAFHDPYVGQARLPDGRVITGVDDPSGFGAQIVLLHTVHHQQDLAWTDDIPLLLDATYRHAANHRGQTP